MSDQSLGLQDDEFWTRPKKVEAVADVLHAAEFSGLRLGAPAAVPVDLRAAAPVVIVHAGPFKDVWALPFHKHALLTAINLDTNVVSAQFAADQDAEYAVVDPARAPAGYTVNFNSRDLREDLGVEWKPARFLVTVISRERLSNRAKVELTRSAQTFDDPEVAKFLDARRPKAGPPGVDPPPGDPLPSYQKRDDSPPVPDEPGIKLAADRVIVLRGETTACVLRGSFRVTALPGEVVKPAAEPAPPPAAGEPPPGPPPTAILRITLLITGSERPFPNTLVLKVPTWDPIPEGGAAPVVTGHFALDLFAAGGMAVRPQTVFVYAFSGEILEGPFPVALISEDMLPK